MSLFLSTTSLLRLQTSPTISVSSATTTLLRVVQLQLSALIWCMTGLRLTTLSSLPRLKNRALSTVRLHLRKMILPLLLVGHGNRRSMFRLARRLKLRPPNRAQPLSGLKVVTAASPRRSCLLFVSEAMVRKPSTTS